MEIKSKIIMKYNLPLYISLNSQGPAIITFHDLGLNHLTNFQVTDLFSHLVPFFTFFTLGEHFWGHWSSLIFSFFLFLTLGESFVSLKSFHLPNLRRPDETLSEWKTVLKPFSLRSYKIFTHLCPELIICCSKSRLAFLFDLKQTIIF